MSETQYVTRVEGMANSYGLGEKVTEGVTLFRAENYNLTLDEINMKLAQLQRKVQQ
jgi:hypothetical protein